MGIDVLKEIDTLEEHIGLVEAFNLDSYDVDLFSIVNHIINGFIIVSYDDSRVIRSRILSLLDKHRSYVTTTFAMSLMSLLPRLSQVTVWKLDTSPECKLDISEGFNEFLEKIEKKLPRGTQIRLSDDLDVGDIDADLRTCFLVGTKQLLEDTSETIKIKESDLEGLFAALTFSRSIAKLDDKLDLYYMWMGAYIERLNISDYYQLARDTAEEQYRASTKDSREATGLFNLFKAYNGQRNSSVASFYALACTARIIKDGYASDALVKNLLFIAIRLFRNLYMEKEAIHLFESITSQMELTRTEYFDVFNTIADVKTMCKDRTIIFELYQYITNNIEFIASQGSVISVPLLAKILNAKHILSDHPDLILFDNILPFLKNVSGVHDTTHVEIQFSGGTDDLDSIYLEKLRRIASTRHPDDIIYDTMQAKFIADRLAEHAYATNSPDRFLRAMIVNTDSTLYLETIDTQLEYPMIEAIQKDYGRIFIQHYDTYSEFIRRGFTDYRSCIWISHVQSVYSLYLSCGHFNDIRVLGDWSYNDMRLWIDRGFEGLEFDETIRKHGVICQYLTEDQEDDLKRITELLSPFHIAEDVTGPIIVIRDNSMSRYPPNLIMDANRQFLSLRHPVSTLFAPEWFILNQHSFHDLPLNPRISFWLPSEGGDLALNLLLERLTSTLQQYGIQAQTEVPPKFPLRGDINIACAHGSYNLSEIPIFHINEDIAVADPVKLIGYGKVLILFICHSGVARDSAFHNGLNSLVRMALDAGYQAVIAPCWALHISVPPIWLPTFLSELMSGETISQAHFRASLAVHHHNRNPGAWACLHLYGNPDLRIGRNAP